MFNPVGSVFLFEDADAPPFGEPAKPVLRPVDYRELWSKEGLVFNSILNDPVPCPYGEVDGGTRKDAAIGPPKISVELGGSDSVAPRDGAVLMALEQHRLEQLRARRIGREQIEAAIISSSAWRDFLFVRRDERRILYEEKIEQRRRAATAAAERGFRSSPSPVQKQTGVSTKKKKSVFQMVAPGGRDGSWRAWQGTNG